jgi:hypothetical protein
MCRGGREFYYALAYALALFSPVPVPSPSVSGHNVRRTPAKGQRAARGACVVIDSVGACRWERMLACDLINLRLAAHAAPLC